MKLKVEKVGDLEERYCKDCGNYMKLTSKSGACMKHIKLVYANYRCNSFEEQVKEIDLKKLVELYYKYDIAVKLFNEVRNTLRQAIIDGVGEGIIGEYQVKISKVKQKRLDTTKVREYLEKEGVYEEFTKDTEYVRLFVRRL